MKRLVALMLAVAVCLSVVGVAMADGGQPGRHKCLYDETVTTRYEQYSTTQHIVIEDHACICKECGDDWYFEDWDFENHSSKDNKTYNYHLGNYHYFYQLCVCGESINQTSAPCPGGDNHIGIILGFPPVVLEAK